VVARSLSAALGGHRSTDIEAIRADNQGGSNAGRAEGCPAATEHADHGMGIWANEDGCGGRAYVLVAGPPQQARAGDSTRARQCRHNCPLVRVQYWREPPPSGQGASGAPDADRWASTYYAFLCYVVGP